MKLIILAGGKGTRLFPISREDEPKQFLKIGDTESLLQKAVKRSMLIAKNLSDIVIVTTEKYKHKVRDHLCEISEKFADFEGIV